MIRIIGGEYRGRKLKVPAGNDVRPTSDRVREALFNLLSSLLSWNEVTVLDLYAGSGALGLEALSRGAKHSIFIDASRRHLKILKQNVELISPDQDRFEEGFNRRDFENETEIGRDHHDYQTENLILLKGRTKS